MFTLSSDRSKKGKELRMVVVETLQDIMKENDKVVALEADLGGASGFTKIQIVLFNAEYLKLTWLG